MTSAPVEKPRPRRVVLEVLRDGRVERVEVTSEQADRLEREAERRRAQR